MSPCSCVACVSGFAPSKLQCIGTSATMASEGSLEDKGRVVARVASKLFSPRRSRRATSSSRPWSGSPIRPRTARLGRPRLGPALDAGIPATISNAELTAHPLSVWVETRLGIVTFSEVDQRWVRARPMTVTEAAQALSSDSGRPGWRPADAATGLPRWSPVDARAKNVPGVQTTVSDTELLRLQAAPIHLGRGPRLCDA
jgi:hypothetical protein